MKYKYLIALYLFGAAINVVGALFKVMHWNYASFTLMIGGAIQAAVIVGGIIKVLNDKDAKSFLNR